MNILHRNHIVFILHLVVVSIWLMYFSAHMLYLFVPRESRIIEFSLELENQKSCDTFGETLAVMAMLCSE